MSLRTSGPPAADVGAFAQSLGYPGQPDHPEVVKTMQEITRRIRQAGRTMQLDVMQGAWVSDMLLDAGRRILPGPMAD
jgi:2-keto-3-deoxy-L-rhamnonate aldolase RhmA